MMMKQMLEAPNHKCPRLSMRATQAEMWQFLKHLSTMAAPTTFHSNLSYICLIMPFPIAVMKTMSIILPNFTNLLSKDCNHKKWGHTGLPPHCPLQRRLVSKNLWSFFTLALIKVRIRSFHSSMFKDFDGSLTDHFFFIFRYLNIKLVWCRSVVL